MAKQKVIRIAAKRDGFRRCGIAHPATETDYPIDRWSKKELAILKAEPSLVVVEAEIEVKSAASKPPASGGKNTGGSTANGGGGKSTGPAAGGGSTKTDKEAGKTA